MDKKQIQKSDDQREYKLQDGRAVKILKKDHVNDLVGEEEKVDEQQQIEVELKKTDELIGNIIINDIEASRYSLEEALDYFKEYVDVIKYCYGKRGLLDKTIGIKSLDIKPDLKNVLDNFKKQYTKEIKGSYEQKDIAKTPTINSKQIIN